MKQIRLTQSARDERGTALVAMLMLGLVLVPLAILAYLTANVEVTAQANKLHADQTFGLAEAGLAHGIDWLFKQDPPPQPLGNAPIDLGTTTVGAHGSYQATVDPDDANDYSGDGPWLYTVSGAGASAHGGNRSVAQTLEIEPVRMGDFVWLFMNMSSGQIYRDSVIGQSYVRRNPDIRRPHGHPNFPNGAVLTKRLFTHSNVMDVSFDDRTDNPYGSSSVPGTTDPVVIAAAAEWWKDWMFGAPDIDLGIYNADGVRARAASHGIVVDGHATVVFMGNIMRLTDKNGTRLVNLPQNHEEPLYVWTSGKVAEVSGVLDGVVVLGSPMQIIQSDDLTYAEDPRTNPDSDDMLILVTEGTYDYANDLKDRPSLTTMARILILQNGTFNTAAGSDAQELWWHFFGSLACNGYTVSRPRRNHVLEWDWRAVPPGIPVIDQILFYDKREHGQSWVELYK
jgi:hypothetical protein